MGIDTLIVALVVVQRTWREVKRLADRFKYHLIALMSLVVATGMQRKLLPQAGDFGQTALQLTLFLIHARFVIQFGFGATLARRESLRLGGPWYGLLIAKVPKLQALRSVVQFLAAGAFIIASVFLPPSIGYAYGIAVRTVMLIVWAKVFGEKVEKPWSVANAVVDTLFGSVLLYFAAGQAGDITPRDLAIGMCLITVNESCFTLGMYLNRQAHLAGEAKETTLTYSATVGMLLPLVLYFQPVGVLPRIMVPVLPVHWTLMVPICLIGFFVLNLVSQYSYQMAGRLPANVMLVLSQLQPAAALVMDVVVFGRKTSTLLFLAIASLLRAVFSGLPSVKATEERNR